ncbi:MAG: ankyrin repeat domain-containing protein [Phycisphaeraceae bacterium]|nr:ankyrin repeat domain-containing protein [Phycisphaeraceae bacterium]
MQHDQSIHKRESVVIGILKFACGWRIAKTHPCLTAFLSATVFCVTAITLSVMVLLGWIAVRQLLPGYDWSASMRFAVSHNVVPRVEELVDRVDLNQFYRKSPGSPPETLLAIACWYRYDEVAEILLKGGADPNIPSHYGLYPLHAAILGHQPGLSPDIIGVLIDHGAHINATSYTYAGRTPLMIAAGVPFPEVVEMLISASRGRIGVNRGDVDGRTALHMAVSAYARAPDEALKTIDLLLKAGANPWQKDFSGRSAADIAEETCSTCHERFLELQRTKPEDTETPEAPEDPEMGLGLSEDRFPDLMIIPRHLAVPSLGSRIG